MFNATLDLAHEFPELKDKIHTLKATNAHFAKLFDQYESVSKELHRIEEEIETPGDAYIEEAKKKRLTLKDEMYSLLTAEVA